MIKYKQVFLNGVIAGLLFALIAIFGVYSNPDRALRAAEQKKEALRRAAQQIEQEAIWGHLIKTLEAENEKLRENETDDGWPILNPRSNRRVSVRNVIND